MQPRKTDLARTALQAHRAPLDMRQRRLLILCDGQRSVTELSGLMGQETPAMLIQLIHAGYLETDAPPPAAAASGRTPARPQAPAPAATPIERRRSLVASRIYLLGILEMQRHPQAAALFHDLQQARAQTDVLQVLHSALQVLPALTSEGYCERVRQRLLEVLPLEHCDAFTDAA
jgi:hypothetical protein